MVLPSVPVDSCHLFFSHIPLQLYISDTMTTRITITPALWPPTPAATPYPYPAPTPYPYPLPPTPAASWLPKILSHIGFQVKIRQSQSYKFKKIAKIFFSHSSLTQGQYKIASVLLKRSWMIYRKVSNIRRTLVSNKLVDHSDVVGASPVGAAPTTSSFLT